MNINIPRLIRSALPVAMLFLTACGGSSSTSSVSTSPFIFSGTISGLFPGNLASILINGSSASSVTASSAYNIDTPFTFTTSLAASAVYVIAASAPTPVAETCSSNNGSGTVGASSTINNILISCSGLEMFAGDPLVIGTSNGSGTGAGFNFPAGLASDNSGNIYVADQSNNAIRMITPTGLVSTVAGIPGTSTAGNVDSPAQPSFNRPWGIAIDSTTGNLYVSDYGNASIRQITPTGQVTTLALTGGTLLGPEGIVFNGGNLYVADSSGHAIKKIVVSTGVVTTLAGTGSPGNVDSSTGTIASFYYPTGITIDSVGYLYVADTSNNAIRRISTKIIHTGHPVGEVVTLAGTPSGGTPVGYQSADGACASAGFYNPEGITIDSSGNLYVADNTNQTIRKVTLTHV